MKTKIIVSLCLLAGFAVMVYISIGIFIGTAVRQGINSFGPRITQTKVELAHAKIAPLSGEGDLTGLFVGNPEGWSIGKAFIFDKVHIKLRPLTVIRKKVLIEEISIDSPEFLYETKIVSSNLRELLRNIEGDKPGAKDELAGTQATLPIKFIVKKFTITNGKTKVGIGPSAVFVPLPTIELKDIGVKEDGLPPGQLAGTLMRAVLTTIAETTAEAHAAQAAAKDPPKKKKRSKTQSQ